MRALLVVLFALSYVGITARRLRVLPIGRPAAAMVGACAMVAAGAVAGPYGLSVDEALRAVELHTLALLLGMMVLAAAFGEASFFDQVADRLGRTVRSGAGMLWAVTLGAGLLSALLVNDAVCLLGTPVVVRLARSTGLPLRPFLFAVAMGANAGSALTLAGNPQNMLVGRLSGLSYAGYLRAVALPGLAALVVTAAVIHALHRAELAAPLRPLDASPPLPSSDPRLLRVAALTLLAVLAANVLGVPLAGGAMAGASVILVAVGARADRLVAKVDGRLLLFFAALFVLVAALQKTGAPRELLASLGQGDAPSLVAVLTLGSQVVSNVPLILLLEPWIRAMPDPHHAWVITALVSTLAGNLTLLGSVANIIVMEQSDAPVGFRDYLKVGVPVTLLSGAAALLLLR
jgi:Na+/H+ antiporter NhaD/arsenite permease-like protein